jgi:hypothetical protein
MRLKTICAGLLFVFFPTVECAELTLEPGTLSGGSTAPLVLRFAAAGHTVSALQFDLEYDSASTLILASNAGAAALGAHKRLYSAPLSEQRWRFVVVGLRNRNVIGDGVIAAIHVYVGASALPGTYPLKLTNLCASDPFGNEVPLTANHGTLTVNVNEAQLQSAVFPQLATGGGWKTSFTLSNLVDTAQKAKLTFWGDDGAPLEVPMAFSPESGLPPTSGAFIEVPLAANGMAVVEMELPASSEPLAGWARMQAPRGVVGSATFRYRPTEGREKVASVVMETRRPEFFVLPYDNRAGFAVGIAIANDSETMAAHIEVILRDAGGEKLLGDTIILPVRGHTAFALTSRYPSLLDTQGSIELRDSRGSGIAVLGLRFGPAWAFTSIPVETR